MSWFNRPVKFGLSALAAVAERIGTAKVDPMTLATVLAVVEQMGVQVTAGAEAQTVIEEKAAAIVELTKNTEQARDQTAATIEMHENAIEAAKGALADRETLNADKMDLAAKEVARVQNLRRLLHPADIKASA